MGKNNDSFFETNEYAFKFVHNALEEIFNASSLPYKYMKNNFKIAVSYVETSEMKIKDYFNFEDDLSSYGGVKDSKLKIVEYPDEIVIDGVKEIVISSVDQFEALLK
jgi:hypothetical protein